ncbi:colicin E3/pyocin S6 family cytotoxin [Mycobacterium sp. NPDC050441]|uniref:colicin E3/pyocin S6 family cytotoxin n=1 Tax=Mycobacterium sp. NPDC050441 TaxID=3155403 RepID=UPI0033D59E75
MAPITADSKILLDAGALYDNARSRAGTALTALTSALDANSGCAGTDNAGHTWANGYDPAALDAVKAGADAVNALAKLHDLLAFTGVNHANAENAANTSPGAKLPPPLAAPTYAAGTFKGSYGGDTDAPMGWGLITRWLQGHLRPNGDPSKLKKLGFAWTEAAKALRDASSTAGPAWANIEDLSSPEFDKALTQMDLVANNVEKLCAQFENLGNACYDWAKHIDDAHQKIREILADTIGWTLVAGAAGAIVGTLLGPEGTVGGAALASGAAASRAAASIVPILAALDVSAGVATGMAAGGIAAAGVAANGITRDLQPLLQANASVYSSDGGEMVSGPAGNYYRRPDNLKAFPNAKRASPKTRMSGGRMRYRWKDKDNIYEWDSQHGTVEVYDKRGVHKGEFDPNTGVQTKPAKPGRSVTP